MPTAPPVKLYSSYDFETVDLHVKWMKEYGIKGLCLQRQQNIIDDDKTRAWRDQVAQHVRKACEKYGVHFLIMPCNNAKSEKQNENVVERFKADWTHLVDDLKITESPMYARQEDKPVVIIWGLGFANRPLTPREATAIIDFFKDSPEPYRAYLAGGVQRGFLNYSGAGNSSGDWLAVYDKLDMITPWRGVQIINSDNARETTVNTLTAEKKWCDQRQIEYLPVIFAGASASGTKGSSPNNIPRLGGQYYWNQLRHPHQ
ncbi:MAG: hypothetical protein HC901_03115 [Bdellovibrionaceae bacterium]|nr:hypothetical protein [Pseudobdellovibrionaceae bacterium]